MTSLLRKEVCVCELHALEHLSETISPLPPPPPPPPPPPRSCYPCTVVYGVTTGFGKFANVFIPKEKVVLVPHTCKHACKHSKDPLFKLHRELQLNLIRSHSCGVGPALSHTRTRMLLVLRINVLAKGFR